MAAGASAGAALQSQVCTPASMKRAHDNTSVQDINMYGSDDEEADGFQLFQTRYSKRLRRQQEQQQLDNQPQPRQRNVRGGRRTGQSGGQRGSLRLGQKRDDQLNQLSQHGGPRQQQQPQQQVDLQQQQSGKLNRFTIYDEVIESVASQGPAAGNVNEEVSCLKAEIHELNHQVASLTSQLQFVLSFLGIDEQVQSSTSTDPTSDPTILDSNVNTYASAARRNARGPIREAMLSAFHSELRLKERRGSNIVVTGLPDTLSVTDEELITDLCKTEFDISLNVVHAKRLGRKVEGRLQPLLVVLQEEEMAKLLLSRAKFLRDSDDAYTANNIYFTAHQTRAERQAAYEDRCRRRVRREAAERAEQAEQRQQRQQVTRVSRDVRNSSSRRGAFGNYVGASAGLSTGNQLNSASGHSVDSQKSAVSVPDAVSELQWSQMSSDDLKAVACMLAAGRQRASAAPSTESAPSTNSVNKPQQAVVSAEGSQLRADVTPFVSSQSSSSVADAASAGSCR